MLDPPPSKFPDTMLRFPAQSRNRPKRSFAPAPNIQRRSKLRDRRLRERHTAHLMTAFGILLGCLELYIVLSYF